MRGRGRPGGGGGEGGRLAALLPFSAWLFSPSLPGSSPHPSSLLVLVGRRGRGRPPWGNLPWGGRAGRQPLPHGDPPAGDSCRWQCSWRSLPVGGEGEGGPVGGEGEGGRLGLFSSPLPGLFSSPLPGLFSPLLPGTHGLITGASAGADAGGTLTPGGGTHDPEAWGWGGPRRRRRAAFSRFDLPQLLLLKSTCELARRRGWECSRAACASARGARSLSRGHSGSGEYLARSHYFTLYQPLPLMPLQEPPAAVVEPFAVRVGSFWLRPGSKLAWRVASR